MAFERTLMVDDPKSKPERLRVSADLETSGLVEIVDAWMTSRSPKAQEMEIIAKIILLPEDARWLRDTLTELLDPVSAREIPRQPQPDAPDAGRG